MMAVIQLVTLENVTCGVPTSKYVTPKISKGKSDLLIAGVKNIFIAVSVIRQNRSDTARPGYRSNINLFSEYIDKMKAYICFHWKRIFCNNDFIYC